MSRLPEVPGGTHLHLKQHVPHARMHRFGLECRLHLTPHSPAQSAKSFSCTMMGLQHRETWLPKNRYVYVLLKEETVLVKGQKNDDGDQPMPQEKKHGEEKLPPAQSHGELVEQRSDEPK
ncbi:hypothetical protein B296_00049873 [Ensete ventricosum]|uniref:Uncharacterized protein n=1 Tax=Ensete ventricosum TaxID=4639 RepID=A0A426Y901_ENSVE|nr:hypothetical protein B296_00049873 [Ensete ventricosum]